ncbi:caspase-8 [Scleropages formosus]|uniref:Caspase-8 n=1 Tax=Scleropages formosus TaxID=113540 RepID=A0A8C9R013_SCLFO|nr:caspase-8-like [Scleropages formosus]
MNNELLLRIDEDLDSEDVAALKFLCRDHIPLKKLEAVQDARDLFLRLEDQGLLGDDDLIVKELLLTIRRFDLLRVLGTSPNQVQNLLQLSSHTTSGISSYRKMLYELSEDVTEDDLDSIKFLLNIPRGRLELCTTFLDVLVEMEKQELLSEDSLTELKRVFSHCNKQLAMKLQQYISGYRIAEPFPVPGYQYRDAETNKINRSHQVQNPLPEVFPSNQHEQPALSLDAQQSSSYDAEEVYSMTHRPRGYCLIINNFNFEEESKNIIGLRNRRGTHRDAEDLTDVFRSLHFEVHLKEDLTASEILKVVKKFGQMDHSTRDAFVCCVLSHGEKGSVYGTDGQLVLIRDVTLPFTCSQCTSLAKKPKLFFIQACQGKAKQCGVSIQADGEGDEQEAEELYDTDARCVVPELASETIPDDSDFLLAMATVEDYKSFRSIKEGSIFIQELCRQLKTGCARNMDILTILTRVNRNVSIGVYLNSKQMPEPRYTLTKKLVLPLD